MTLSSPSVHNTSAIPHTPRSQEDTRSTQGSIEDEYLATVKRMQAKQDAWSQAARSASASASASESPGESRSRSPSKLGDGQYGSTGFHSGSIGDPSGSGSGQQKKGRKKVAKACLACQKSHVTCDDKRPCTRCVKKGIGEQCVEGVRKKAKYLLEEDEKTALEASQSSQTQGQTHIHHPSVSPTIHQQRPQISPNYSLDQSFTNNSEPVPSLSHSSHSMSNLPPSLQPNNIPRQSGLPDDIWLAPPLDGDNGIGLSGVGDSRMWFGSGGGISMGDNSGNSAPFNTNGMTAATSEYAMLDSMFAMDPVFPGLGGLDGLEQPMQIDNQFVDRSWGGQESDALLGQQPQSNHSGNGLGNNLHGDSFSMNLSTSISTNQNQSSGRIQNQIHDPTSHNQTQNSFPSSNNTMLTTPPSFDLPNSPWTAWLNNQTSGGVDANVLSTSGGGATTAAGLLAAGSGKKTMSSSEVYKTVTKPYDYTEGYHTLMEYLTTNFERKEILRVVHSLASYRPSLIALQMPMSEEDEVFLEKSFQRTLIELEKLISYSATPTAVWRRTGEVCYANPEFCSLVKRNENDLFGKKNYIYQLFSKPSVIAYWENFSVHAFENTTQNFFQSTSVKLGHASGRSDKSIDCSCCFTIRRDVFDLPSVVIGQFLPIPQES